MYLRFYGFSEKPFNLTPDPKFLYLTESHREALYSMLYGIKERMGFISITGEVGTGKTTLIYTLLNNLNEKVKSVFLYHTNITFEQLLKNILYELDVPINNEDKVSLLRRLNEYLVQIISREETLAIIIDEAQNLPKEVMEEIRMLSNSETCKSKLLQIILVGQPELESKINSKDLRQLKQRIGIRCQIKRLSKEESKHYIEHRLRLVGSSSKKVFTPEALSMMSKCSKGIPRTINVLCNNAFLIGFSETKKKIDAKIVKEVISDIEGSIVKTFTESKSSEVKTHLPTSKATAFLYNKAVAPALLLLCLCLSILLGKGYIQGNYPQTDDSKNTENVYFKKTKEDNGILEKAKVPHVNTNLFSDEVKTDLVKRSASSNTASECGPTSQGSHQYLQQVINSYTPNPSSKKRNTIHQIVTVKEGYCISYLARKYYHMTSETLIDFILEANPGINNIHYIKINQQLKIPKITDESLIISLSDNNYKIYAGTFKTPNHAQIYFNEPILKGKEINLIPRKVSSHDIWYRVELGNYISKEESLEAITILKQKGLLSSFGTIS